MKTFAEMTKSERLAMVTPEAIVNTASASQFWMIREEIPKALARRGPLLTAELAEEINCERSDIIRFVQRLHQKEKTELEDLGIVRIVNPEDRRENIWALQSQVGEAKKEEMVKGMRSDPLSTLLRG